MQTRAISRGEAPTVAALDRTGPRYTGRRAVHREAVPHDLGRPRSGLGRVRAP
ncbi:hypothetical protein [Nonomuraea dietziae]|uniref:hypothetical protein n=1 Tax=Nonomuraea dietziae TaxID=65515 RepID=UPI0031CDE42D